MNLPKSLFWGAVCCALLSSLRIPILPELEFGLFVLYTIKKRGLDYDGLIFLFLILCTHHYAIPDAVFREDASSYPSIYTKQIGAIKILDLLIVYLFIISYKYYDRILKVFSIKSLPTVLLITSFFGFISPSRLHLSSDIFLFIARSYLLILTIFINSIHFSKKQFSTLAYLAVVCWISKMIFSILFPHPHPWYREILGYNGIMYFAGDEYMYIPAYLAIIVYIFRDKIVYKKTLRILFLTLLLVIIAQRKGGIPILFSFILLVSFYYHKNTFLSNCLKVYYVFSGLIIFLFLLFIDHLVNDELILLAFSEYHILSKVSWDSFINLFSSGGIWSGFWGITPFGKYEVIGLPNIADHFMAWGTEVGEKYRYQLWVFPFGRCIMNAGLWGWLIFLLYYIKIFRYQLPLFFLTISCFVFCIYGNITPVCALSIGFSLAFIYNVQNRITYL